MSLLPNPAELTLRTKRSVLSWLVRRRSRGGVLAVEIRSTVGLGAKLEWCLELMAYCQEHGLQPVFRFSYPDAAPAEDYFAPLFTMKHTVPALPRFVSISSIIELDLGKEYDSLLTIDWAHRLIGTYLEIREDIVREVDEFCSRRFPSGGVLGVHYRGTDKILESPAVPYERVRRNVERYLELYPATGGVLVATDDANFLDFMQVQPLNRPLVWREDAFRSRDGLPVHESAAMDRHAVNRDALVNCLLLSRCEALLKTASILSGWSKLFNPRLPVVMLNRPHLDQLWFPERALVASGPFEPVE